MQRGRRRSSNSSIFSLKTGFADIDDALARLKAEQQAPASIQIPSQMTATTGPALHLNVPLLLTAEPLLSIQIRADSRTGKHLAGELTDRTSLVSRGSANDLIRGLIKAGHTPKVNE